MSMGNGLPDIVFTHRGLEPPSVVEEWRKGRWGDGGKGEGEKGVSNREFATRNSLPGVDNYAYSMGWADLNGDGALDLVTGLMALN